MTNRNNGNHNGGGHNYVPTGNQHQGQAQGQMEAQLQGQMQGQGQHQGQGQSQSSESLNLNGNGNLNGNANGNLNGNGNLNQNDNLNTASNTATNQATNTSETTTTVTVDVGVTGAFDMTDYVPSDDDFADIDLSGGASVDNLLMAQGDVSFDPGNEMNLDEILDGALNGQGNDVGFVNAQSNNLIDSDVLHNATVGGNLNSSGSNATGGSASSGDGIGATAGAAEAASFGGGHGGHGGGGHGGGHGGPQEEDASMAGAWGSDNGDDGYVTGEALSSASAEIDTTAFNQSIVMGANILGNTVDMSVVGGNMNSTYIGDDSTDGA